MAKADSGVCTFARRAFATRANCSLIELSIISPWFTVYPIDSNEHCHFDAELPIETLHCSRTKRLSAIEMQSSAKVSILFATECCNRTDSSSFSWCINLISAMFAVEHCLKGSKQTCSISVLEWSLKETQWTSMELHEAEWNWMRLNGTQWYYIRNRVRLILKEADTKAMSERQEGGLSFYVLPFSFVNAEIHSESFWISENLKSLNERHR